MFIHSWSELTVWPKGILVKHVKGLFKADGINNAAEPGNSMHYKFYVSTGLVKLHRSYPMTTDWLRVSWECPKFQKTKPLLVHLN